MSKHIVLATWGSLGDLHPMMAVALELQKRGHRATIATSELYRAKVEDSGLDYFAVRPDLPSDADMPELLRRAMHSRGGTRFIFETLLTPHLRHNYDDLSEATRDADLLVSHATVLAGPLVAQKRNLRWISAVLAPLSLFSVSDPPVLPGQPRLAQIYRFGKPATRLVFQLAEWQTRSWVAPVDKLRAELGLPRGAHPMFSGQYSPRGTMALFSRELGEPQPDWPANTRQTGFAFYDKKGYLSVPGTDETTPDGANSFSGATMPAGEEKGELSPHLAQFLAECDAANEAPVVFTLGSAASFGGAQFFERSARAAQILGCRALLVGTFQNQKFEDNPKIAVFDYAPYSLVFSRARTIVHQGGVGTTAQALRAGKPMLVVPHSHDQNDNGARITRRGFGRDLPLHFYTPERVVAELKALLSDTECASRVAEVGARIRAENGASNAADFLEEQLAAPR